MCVLCRTSRQPACHTTKLPLLRARGGGGGVRVCPAPAPSHCPRACTRRSLPQVSPPRASSPRPGHPSPGPPLAAWEVREAEGAPYARAWAPRPWIAHAVPRRDCPVPRSRCPNHPGRLRQEAGGGRERPGPGACGAACPPPFTRQHAHAPHFAGWVSVALENTFSGARACMPCVLPRWLAAVV